MAVHMSARRDFPPSPTSLRGVRRLVARNLAGFAEVADVEWVASEFASNVVKHADTHYRVSIDVDRDRTRLEVSDGSSIFPAVEEVADPTSGLRVVEAMADRWGVEATGGGKTVWAEFHT